MRPWFWIFVGAAMLYAGLLTPLIGTILAVFLLPLVAAPLLVHVGMILLAKDCYRGLAPKILLVVPVFFYAAGLTLFVASAYQALTLSHYVDTLERPVSVPFQPESQDLISDPPAWQGMSRELQANYEINSIYSSVPDWQPEGYAVSRVVPRRSCKSGPSSKIFSSGISINRRFVPNACVLTYPERPSGEQVKLVETAYKQKWGMFDADFKQTEIQIADQAGVVITAQTQIYAPVLFVMAACLGPNCQFGNLHFAFDVGGTKGNVARADKVATWLGLKRRVMNKNGAIPLG